jgi:predicted metal-dependent HD superfamily phosphohydrolase
MYGDSVFECRHQPFAMPSLLSAELAAAYRESHRAYHDEHHIAEVLRWFDEIAHGPGWRNPADVYTAIVFHDAIYVPGAKDNETRSAARARRAIAEHELPADANRVADLIELTSQHGSLDSAEGDTALFLDADMAIVGASPEVYREYARQIRREYGMVPANAYRAGREAFVKALLEKTQIYFSDYFKTRLTVRALQNLAGELSTLRSGAPNEADSDLAERSKPSPSD